MQDNRPTYLPMATPLKARWVLREDGRELFDWLWL